MSTFLFKKKCHTLSFSDTTTISSSSTTKSSNNKPIKPIFTKGVIDDLLAHDFSTSRMQYWFDRGLAINEKDTNGNSLLIILVKKGDYTGAKWLIDKGADVNLQNNEGNTPIMYVNLDHRNSVQMIDYLLKSVADPCKKNKKGQWVAHKRGIASNRKLKEASDQCRQKGN